MTCSYVLDSLFVSANAVLASLLVSAAVALANVVDSVAVMLASLFVSTAVMVATLLVSVAANLASFNDTLTLVPVTMLWKRHVTFFIRCQKGIRMLNVVAVN